MANKKFKGPERRGSHRIQQHFIAKVRVEDSGTRPWSIVLARNLGLGGILFSGDLGLPAKTPLRLIMNFPLTTEPLAGEAQVIRSSPIEGENRFETACIFTRLDQIAQDAIRAAAEILHPAKHKPGN